MTAAQIIVLGLLLVVVAAAFRRDQLEEARESLARRAKPETDRREDQRDRADDVNDNPNDATGDAN